LEKTKRLSEAEMLNEEADTQVLWIYFESIRLGPKGAGKHKHRDNGAGYTNMPKIEESD
jgi:hypothetical protein